MEFRDSTEFRRQAGDCFNRSVVASDPSSKLQWLSLAEGWLLMADNVEQNDAYDTYRAPISHRIDNVQYARH